MADKEEPGRRAQLGREPPIQGRDKGARRLPAQLVNRLPTVPMGLSQTKHVYVDRDMMPEMFHLLCLAEAVSPRVIWVLVAVGIVSLSR